MFKLYKDICDVISLIVYCPSERSYLLTKESSGELWVPSLRCDKNCWKTTAIRIIGELFGAETPPPTPFSPFRVNKIWLPNHSHNSAYHAIYKIIIKSEAKKKLKLKSGMKNRLQWLNATELERQRAHAALRSPELATYALMITGEHAKELITADLDFSPLTEICEEQVLVGCDVGAGAVTLASGVQLLNAAGYNKDDQLHLYREFVVLVYPCLYMSVNTFMQFMTDVGFQRQQCQALFRAADVTGRGGLTFVELMMWCAALEPSTQHSGVAAEVRCRYIFRYFDSNRDGKLEYVEFKELVAATRADRQLPVDALSVARDADVVLRQLGIQPNSQLLLTDFLRAVSELRLRGTSTFLRAPKSISAYITDLHERDKELLQSTSPTSSKTVGNGGSDKLYGSHIISDSRAASACRHEPKRISPDYSVAVYTVRMQRKPPHEMVELNTFDEDAVSPSTARLISGVAPSLDVLGPGALPVEALAAVHYFATAVEKPVFCCHGGIPPPWVCPLITAIDKVPVPLCRPAEQSSIAWELLWNDPVKPNKLTATLQMELAANEGFAANTKRGTGHVFDQTALDRFLAANQLSHVVRAHELHQNGFMCQLRGRLISVFSSYRYCGGTNDSGVALLEGGKLRLLRVNAEE